MGYESRPATDMASRVMSIFGLIVALGALAMFLTQSRTLETRSEMQASFDEQLKEAKLLHAEKLETVSKSYQDALTQQELRMKEWNATLNSVVETFEADADFRLARIDDEGREQRVAFRQALNDLQISSNQAGSPADSNLLNAPKNASSTDPANARPSMAKATEGALQVADSRLRPTGDPREVTLTIANLSNAPQSIRRVRFRPKSRFSLTADDKLSLDSADATVTFQTDDNKTSTKGFHGTYEHRLDTPIVIGPSEKASIRLAIADSQYAGWGFVGKLLVDYNNGSLQVDSARVVFE